MMTLDEARHHIGEAVIYQSHPSAPRQDGTIVSVKDTSVRVRYSHNDASIQSTPPGMLTLLQGV